MSNRKKPKKEQPPHPSKEERELSTEGDVAFWIYTNPTDKGFRVGIKAAGGHDITITPAQARDHAEAVLLVAARAEYDAAVFCQMYDLVENLDAVGQIVLDLRRDRPEIDQQRTFPLVLTPGVAQDGAGEYRPFIAISIDGVEEQVSQWTPDEARAHAVGLIETITAADLDQDYLRVLTGLVGIERARALNVIGDLQRWRYRP